MVSYIRSDLEFILDQIKISEQHAAGAPLFGPGGLVPAYNLSLGLRTVDGTYNNLLHPEWGAADNEFPEPLGTEFRTIMVDVDPGPGVTLAPVSYTPGVNNGMGPSNVIDPTIRTISNLLVDQTLGNPSAILTALQRAGIVPPEDQMAVTATISAAFAPLRPLFNAVSEAERENAAAQAAASASPNNPDLQLAAAATAAALASAQADLDLNDDTLMDLLAANGIELQGANIVLTNIAPDEGLSAPFNSWFTLFGQFFDHGLDLVAKGGSGTVFIPLMPDDPLYVPGGDANFMVLTRATLAGPGADGILGDNPLTVGVNEGADDTDRPVNTTTSFVDQNQTYSSHASHQVFLREYEFSVDSVLDVDTNPDSHPVATGKLIEGINSGMATWADVKAQAADLLGIQLLDSNVGNIPLLATDPYGEFIRGPNGYPLLVTSIGLIEGDPAANGGLGVLVDDPAHIPPYTTIRTGHAFLADIAHNAVPDGLADGDIEIGLNNPGFDPGDYDNELLDAHFMAGDGRANENIGLTAVHHVFHSEHNRLVDHTKSVVIADAAAMLAGGATQADATAFLNEWLTVDVAAVPVGAAIDALVWDGERLFQAAKFGTEMQYQHLVFEEFARKIQPQINPFLVPDGFDVTIDPSIVAEFAHVVYRFGHSMLTETIDRFDSNFNADHIGLIEGFLNPIQFQNNGTDGTVDADISAGAIIRGMTRQEGNHIDEFVTSALRNNLLGLPLDLATINLARGRDTGVPSLNSARADFYAATNNAAELKPYESWVDFAGHLKNEASIINFIAAYGTHSLIANETTIEGKRDAALTIITGVSVGGFTVPADAEDFLNATGAYAAGMPGSTLGGLNDVDLWIGGLAEQTMPFGGMLGSTFNFVFEHQMESLQNGDRFYYLQRLDGLHLFGEMEANSFASLIMRNTDATHLPSDVFSAPGLILEVDRTKQYNPGLGETAGLDGILDDDPNTLIDESADNLGNDPTGGGILTQLVVRNNPATPGADTNYLKYTGGDHVVLGGTEAADILIAGIGDDTLFGDGGNDNLEGGFGNDIINAGAGDDIVRDIGGDDNIKAGDGNDVVHAGPGLDLVMGGKGQDFIVLGTDAGSEVFAGEGNDFILGNKNAERILGNEGNDWLETGTFDGAPGDNFDEIFARDGIDGHDVFLGDGGFDEFIGEGGDDIMVGSPGRGKMAGMSGYDWVTYKDNVSAINADLSIPIIFDESPTLPQNAALDEFESMEGLSGSRFNDILKGSNEDATTLLPMALGGSNGFLGSALDAQGIALISGLQAVLGTGVNSFAAGDIILGGDGSDLIQGNAGDDIIDGDKWLDVQIGVWETTDRIGDPIELVNSMTALSARMFSGAINPGQLAIVRTIRTDTTAGDIDTAQYQGNRSEYAFSATADGQVIVTHAIEDAIDGTDRLRNIEKVQFLDGGALNIVVGTPGNDTALTGTAGDDLILGLAGNDTLIGLAGNDILVGGPGTDTLNGGLGNDTYSFSFGDGIDTINEPVNATSGGTEDRISILSPLGVMTGLNANDSNTGTNNGNLVITFNGQQVTVNGHYTGTVAGTGVERINFNGATYSGYLLGAADYLVNRLDPNNRDAGGVNLSASTVDNFVAGEQGVDDVITGGSGNDLIFGGTGDNELHGGAGDDLLVGSSDAGDDDEILDGGLDADTMVGLAGDDTYIVDDLGDVVVEAAGAGTDEVETEMAELSIEFMANVENLTYTGLDADPFIGTGNSLNNVITGGDLADTLNGLGGNDTLNGGLGNDILNGGDNNDTLNGGDDNDTLNGDLGNDALNGGDGNDTLNGGDGSDTLNGNDGNDTLDGGIGVDAMNGGAGDDTFFVDNTADTVIEGGGGGTDTVNSTVTYTITDADVENLTLLGTANINGTGNGSANVLTGNSGNNSLSGLGGADTAAFSGPVLNYSFSLSGANLLVTSLADGADTLNSIENLRFGAQTLALLVGTNAANTLNGGANANLVLGFDGIDTINAGGGDDAVFGGSGNDIINYTMGGGVDTVDGGADSDTLNIIGTGANETLDVIYNGTAITSVEGGAIANVETITADLNGAADTLSYVGTTVGVTVNLTLGTATGFLSIADILNATGGSGNDILIAGAGNNTLNGGLGSDTYTVNSTGDVVIDTGAGIDLVNASVTYTISDADVENLTLLGIANINGTGNGSANVIIGNSGNNILAGAGGTDTVNGGDGNDTFNYTIGDGADTIIGGNGADVLNIVGLNNNDVLDVIYSGGTLITGLEGGTVTGVETITANLGGNADTLSYAGSTVGVTVSLGAGTASGFNSIASIRDVVGGSGNDTLTANGGTNVLDGGAGVDTINGGAGADTLIGGAGADIINTGAADDNVVDIVRFSDTIDFGDTVTNFDANGTVDRVEFGGTLNTNLDDGSNDDSFTFVTGNGIAAVQTVNMGTDNGDIEALLLTGAGGEGVTTALLGNATAVSAAFNSAFDFTDNGNGQDLLLVINDTDVGGNSFALWQWTQAGGGETSAAELTHIATISGNATVTAASFDFFA